MVGLKIRQLPVLFLLMFHFTAIAQTKVAKWKVYELTLKEPITGNPFNDIQLTGKFYNGKDTFTVGGFCDGVGIYKHWFMPSKEGK